MRSKNFGNYWAAVTIFLGSNRMTDQPIMENSYSTIL